MTVLLTVLVILLAVLVVVQVMKVNQLSSKMQNHKDNEVSAKDNNTQGTLMFVVGMLFILSTIWMAYKWGPYILPMPASEHGVQYDNLMWISLVVIILVFLIVNPILFGPESFGRELFRA